MEPLRNGYWNGTGDVSNFVPPADALNNITLYLKCSA